MTADRAALVAAAHRSIRRGSKSFAFASRLFDQRTRERAWLLYAWCRRCDDLADDQDMGGALGEHAGAATRIDTIRRLTDRAFAGEPTGDRAFDAFGLVARECAITRAMADDVIAGFALDAADWRPRSEADLARYCYHVAGAVGVMMALVMGVPPTDEETLDRACDMGLAFQLANIARDLDEDDKADRCYLPVEWLVEQDLEPGQQMKPHHRGEVVEMTARLTSRMDDHLAMARIGAARLPLRSRWAVLSAARIYGAIGHTVRDRGAAAWDHRVVISPAAKMRHVAAALVEAVRNRPAPVARPPRWSRTAIRAALPSAG